MIKKILLSLAVISGPLTPTIAMNLPLTYVHTSTWTAGGSGTKAWAFQNQSADLDVRILRLEIGSATGATVSSGLMQFWILGSTVVTAGGTGQVSFYSNSTANVTAPSYISVSTGPVNVVYEGRQGSQLPLTRPLIVNADESATSSLSDSLNFNAPADASELILPHGSNRAIVVEQRQFGASDFTAGVLFLRLIYTVQ